MTLKFKLVFFLAGVFLLTTCTKDRTCTFQSSWSTQLDFTHTYDAFAHDITTDPFGNIFVAAKGTNSSSVSRWLILKSPDGGSSWNVVDDFQYVSGENSSAVSVTADALGNVYAAGEVDDGANGLRWLVRKSLNSGQSWFTVDTYQYVATKDTFAAYIVANTLGEIYGLLRPKDGANTFHSLIRKSIDGGASWKNVDDFQYVAGQDTNSTILTLNLKGHLFLAASGKDGGGIYHWLVRKSTDLGSTWTTIDDFQLVTGKISSARTLLFDGNGSFYVFGRGLDAGNVSHWLVRKSLNDGQSWSTIDDFQFAAGQLAYAWSAFVDNFGSLYAIGFGFDSAPDLYWLLRKSTDKGSTWTTTDTFRYNASTTSVTPRGSAIGPGGDLLVAGFSNDGTNFHAIVRKIACE